MQPDPTSLLKGLVEIYSPSQQERRASDYLAAQMEALGYDRAFVDAADNAVGIIGDGPREIVLLGHIDTVPGYINVEIRDGKLYGRGTVDAKGPLATFVAGAAKVGRQPGWRIVVIGAVEEEAVSSKGAHYATTVYKPELCIIGEPSRWDRVTLGYKGRLLLEYRCVRPIHHTALPEPNAIEYAISYWNTVMAEIQGINESRERAFDQVFATVRSLQTSSDGLYESSTMTLGFRLPPDIPPSVFKPRLLDFADHAEITFRGEEVAFRGERNTPLVRAFNNAIRDVGGKPGYVYKTGTCDMNIVGPIWNCPIAAYGPGDSTLDHTPEEHIVLDEYHRAVDVIAGVLRSLGEA